MKLLFVYLIFAFFVDDNKKLTIAAVKVVQPVFGPITVGWFPLHLPVYTLVLLLVTWQQQLQISFDLKIKAAKPVRVLN